MSQVKLRGDRRRRDGLYPLGEIPRDVVIAIGRKIVHRVAVGIADIKGDDFGGMFASAVGGNHRSSPLGIADVVLDDCAWSTKTVKAIKPFEKKKIRLISGRNAPVFSQDIHDPFQDPQATGNAVLEIWNARINEALAEYDDLRIFVMIRNIATLEFTIFEFVAERFILLHYRWTRNKKNNLVGFNLDTGFQEFTWQPHGSQFTIHHDVPSSAQKFRILHHPPLLHSEAEALEKIGFNDSWIQSVSS